MIGRFWFEVVEDGSGFGNGLFGNIFSNIFLLF